MKRALMLLGTVTLLAGCATNPPAAPPPPVDLNNPLFAPAYMEMAASSDQFEIQSGQLALQMSQNPAVRSFGNMLIADHTRSTQMVAAAAQSARIAPIAPALLPPQQAMLDQLRAAGSGPSFDVAFRDLQISAHQQALQLHQNYAAGGDVPALRMAAGQIALVVQMHLNQLQAMNVAAAPPLPPPPPPSPPPAGRRGERG